MKNIIRKFKFLMKYIFVPKVTGSYQYKDYQDYKESQIKRNIQKIGSVWVQENNIKFLSEILKKEVKDIKFGICHGTRRGKEQEWFMKYLDADVIGTEISPTANDFPNTIQWDFNKVKEEWINNVDFIYSNSFDHTNNPEKCLDAWMSCIKKEGMLILEWTNGSIEFTRNDPFGATIKQYEDLINKKYKIKRIIKTPDYCWWKLKLNYFIFVEHSH